MAARANRRQGPALDCDKLMDQLVTEVSSKGKHLFIKLANEFTIHSHMGMTGSWHVYPSGATWRKPANRAALVLETDHEFVAVCFTPKSLEILSTTQLRRHRWLSQLGPDILDEDWSADEIIGRFRINPTVPTGVAVMDQRIVCGMGNIYKSELLFLERLDPFGPISHLSDQALASLLTRGHDLMRRNLRGRPRRTRFASDGNRKWVYDRSGEPCFDCGQTIAMRRQGDLGRSTYYCGECQNVSTRLA